MKKISVFRTVLSIVLIVAIIAVGVFVVLMTNNVQKSKLHVNIVNLDLKMNVSGGMTWSGETWNTTTEASGFKDSEWTMDDLVLTTTNETTPAELTLSFENMNITNAAQFDIDISGLAYDEYDRFTTKVVLSCDGTQMPAVEITKNNRTANFSEILNTTQNVTIKISYTLNKENSSFSGDNKFVQDIIFKISSSEV